MTGKECRMWIKCKNRGYSGRADIELNREQLWMRNEKMRKEEKDEERDPYR